MSVTYGFSTESSIAGTTKSMTYTLANDELVLTDGSFEMHLFPVEKPPAAIEVKLVLAIDFSGFNQTAFIINLARDLDISVKNIIVLAVEAGSTVVNFLVSARPCACAGVHY
jgi:hypothetical protein